MFILVYNYIASVDDILYKINNEQRNHDIFRGLSINLPFVRCCPLHNKSVGDDALGVPIFLAHWIIGKYHNNVTSIIRHQEYNNHGITPPNGLSHFGETEIEPSPYNLEFTANPQHGRPQIAPAVYSATSYRRKIATLGAVFYFVLEHNSVQLCSFLTPHFSPLTPNSYFPLCILPLNPTKSIELISIFTKMRKFTKNLLTFLYGCGIV